MSRINDGTLSFAAVLDTTAYQRGLRLLEQATHGAASSVTSDFGSIVGGTNAIGNSMKHLAGLVGGYFSFRAVSDFARQIFNVRKEIQSLEISFETLLGSKPKADALFGSIRKFAVETPMQLKDLASAAQLMLSFNIGEDKIMPYLKALGDISMGDTQRFNSLALAFSQMSSAGKLMGQDLMQMINAGFNPLAQMAEKTGKSIAELKEEMSAGKITAEMVQQAFVDATSEGGKYFGMLEKQSKGLAGAYSNLQGAMDDMFNELGEKTQGVMVEAIEVATSLAKNYKTVAEAALTAASAFGAYKAAVMLDTAKSNAVNAAKYEVEFAELSKLVPLKEQEANADIRIAVAEGRMTQAKAEALIAMRAEAAAAVEAMRAKAAEAKLDVERATTAHATAQAKLFAATQELKATQLRLNAAVASGDMFAIEAATAERDAAAQARDAAAKELNAAATDIKTKKQAASVAAIEAETAATNLNSAAEKGSTASASLLTAAKTKLIGAVRALYATISAHPYALAAAAAIALGYAIYKLVTHQTEAEKAQKKLNESFAKSDSAARSEIATIETLFKTLKSAKEGTSAYKVAKDAIINQYGQYLQGLVDEKNNLKDIEQAYRLVATAAKEAARERGIADATQQAQDTFQTSTQRSYDKMFKFLRDKKGSDGEKLYEMMRMDLEGEGKLSQSTLTQLYKSFGAVTQQKGKNGKLSYKIDYNNSDVVQLKKWAAEVTEANNILTQSVENISKKYGEMSNNFTSYSNASLKAEREALELAIQNKQTKGYQITLGGQIVQTLENEIDARLALKKLDEAIQATSDQNTVSELENYNKRKKAYEDAKGALEDIAKNRDKYEEGAYEKAEKEFEEAKKRFKAVGGNVDEKSARAANQSAKDRIKISDLEKKQAREEARAAQDLEWQVRQAVIDAMQEGEEKQIRQMQLNHEKEIEEIGRQREDLLQSKIDAARAIWDADSKNEGKEFDSSGIGLTQKEEDNFANLMADANKKYANQEAIIAQQRAQSMNEYLRQWGDLQERIQAVRDLRDQALATESDEGKRKTIVAEANQQIAELESNADRSSSAIAKLFSDMSKSSVADLKAIAEAGQEAIDFIEGGEWDEAKGLELGISKETFDYLQKTPEELKKCKDAVAQIKQEASSLGSPLDQVADGLKKLFSAGNNQKKLQQGLTQLQEGVNKIGAAVSVVQNAASELADAFGSEVMGGIADGLSVASDAMSGAMQGAQAGAAFGPWGAAAGAAIGLVGKLGSSLAKLHDAKHEKTIQKIQERIEVLKESYDKLGRSIEKAYSKDASRLIDQQNVMLRQQQALIRKQIAEEKSKKKADQDRIKEWEDQIKEIDQTIADNKEKAIDAIFGEDVKSAISNFADAYASMFEAGNTKAKAAKDVVRSMIKQMVVELMKSDISNFMESFRAKMMEYWTDNIIEDWEEQALQNLAEQELGQLSGKYSWADKYFKDLYGQNSTSGGFQAMSQDSADELNGRFTALQMSAVSIDASLAGIALNVEAMRSVADFNRTALDEIRSVSAIALMHLENIDTNTRQLKSMNDRLDKIERNTQRI